MKQLKLMLSLVILVFATTAGFSQQTKPSETNAKPDKVSRKQAQKAKPDAVKEMQDKREIGQGKPEWAGKDKEEKEAIKKDRKSTNVKKNKGKKGQNGKMGTAHKNKRPGMNGQSSKMKQPQPVEEKAMPQKDGRYPSKDDKVMRPEKTKEEGEIKKHRSRKRL